jgi:hypothetical protein
MKSKSGGSSPDEKIDTMPKNKTKQTNEKVKKTSKQKVIICKGKGSVDA